MGGWLAVSQLGKWAGGGAHPPPSTFWLHHSSPLEAQPRSPLPTICLRPRAKLTHSQVWACPDSTGLQGCWRTETCSIQSSSQRCNFLLGFAFD